MGEANQYTFDFKELAAMMVKQQNIHEGLWAIYIEFGIQAANAGPSENQIFPTAIVPIVKIGIQKVTVESNLSVDAAKVN